MKGNWKHGESFKQSNNIIRFVGWEYHSGCNLEGSKTGEKERLVKKGGLRLGTCTFFFLYILYILPLKGKILK